MVPGTVASLPPPLAFDGAVVAAAAPAGDPFGFGPDAPMEPRAAEEPAGDPVAFPTREGGGAGFLAVVPLAFAPADEATPDLAFIPPGTTPGDANRLTPC